MSQQQPPAPAKALRTVIPFGPQHPVFPEPIQLRLIMDDEKIVEALPMLGYVHRGLEKIGEQKEFLQNVFLVERVCGICSFIHALAYCQGIEHLMSIAVPDRARYLRVIWSELHRLHSHLLWLGLLADSFGFENLFMQVWRCRETILDLQELTGGGRIIVSTCQIGGVKRDIPYDLRQRVLEGLDQVERDLESIIDTTENDYSVKQRLVGVGALTAEQAYRLGAVGPVLRACGVKTDHRLTGYAAYGDLDFRAVTWDGGDCYARSMVRLYEMPESIRLIREAFRKMPERSADRRARPEVLVARARPLHHLRLLRRDLPQEVPAARAPARPDPRGGRREGQWLVDSICMRGPSPAASWTTSWRRCPPAGTSRSCASRWSSDPAPAWFPRAWSCTSAN